MRGVVLLEVLLLGGCHRVFPLDERVDAAPSDVLDASPDAAFDPITCPVDYMFLDGLPHSRYRFVLADARFAEHDSACRLDGPVSHLLLIETQAEGFAVDRYLDLLGLQAYFWVGVTQNSAAAATDEGWSWLSGRPLDADLWFSGEPGDGSDGTENHEEDHGMIARFGSAGNQIIDAPAGSMHHAVCECDGITLPR